MIGTFIVIAVLGEILLGGWAALFSVIAGVIAYAIGYMHGFERRPK